MTSGNKLLATAVLCSAGFALVIAGVARRVLESRESLRKKTPGIRGAILDRRGMALALTEEASIIAASPREIIDPDFTARHLAPYLQEDPARLAERFRKREKSAYLALKRQVDNYIAERIMELKLPGIHREREYKRVYPSGTLAGNLLGFVGRDHNRALAGLERIFHKRLSVSENDGERRGPSLYLTIDSLLQHRLDRELGLAFQESGSRRATGILMNVRTGEILAISNFPNYDPNEYYKTRPFQRRNWALRFHYEPGSTVKIFMAAMLLQENAVRPDETFLCEGSIEFGEAAVHCKARNRIIKHGRLNLAGILERSCNVGTIKAMKRISRRKLHEYMSALGFGRKTGVLPRGETSAYFPGLNVMTLSSRYYMPIGQSFSVTPIQLLRAASSIANGGSLFKPLLVRKFVSARGRVLERSEIERSRNPFSPGVNARVLRLMQGVVRNGTGRGAYLRSMPAAGKTGTGQKATAAGYIDKYTASFLGFFPRDRPRYGMLILFDEPRGHAGGGSLAAPVFRKTLQSILPIIDPEVKTVGPGLLRPLPSPATGTNPGSLRDFRGLSAREALGIASRIYNLPVRLYGSGYVFRQFPPPGTDPRKIKILKLYLDDY